MARNIRLDKLMFHSYSCMASALPALKNEIQNLEQGQDVTFSDVTSVVNPIATETTENNEYGTVKFDVLRCSEPSCNVSQKLKSSKEGWILVKIF